MSKSSYLFRCAALALAFGAMANLAAPMASPSGALAQSARSDSYLFAFQDAEISKVVQEVLDSINAPYQIDPAVNGRMSLRIDQRLTRAQLIETLDAALAAYGVALIRDKDRLFITPMAKAKNAAPVKAYQAGARRVGYEVVAVPLAYAQPSEVAKALETIGGKELLLLPYDKLGLMVIGGGGQDLESTLETLKIFDQNVFGDSKLRWFQLTQADAAVVAGEIEKLVQGSGAAGVTVVPLRRLNGLMVFARSGDILDKMREWIARLDVTEGQGASSIWIYHPRHTNAESLAQTLSAIMNADGRDAAYGGYGAGQQRFGSGASPSSATTSGATVTGDRTGQDATLGANGSLMNNGRVTVDKESNTLFLTGPASDWVKAQKILNEIDRLPSQILVEASIVEVTLNDDFQFGVDWSVMSGDFQVSSLNNSTGSIGPSYPGGSITFLHGNIAAALSALGSKAIIQVVSAPKIVVLDNKTARLQIGDQVPVVNKTSQDTSTGNAPILNSIDYRSTGVILSVTPHISGSDQVKLDVSQEVSSVAKTSSSGIDSPTIQQRRFESALILQNGSVVALGGLINANVTTAKSGVPGLKSIPIAGSLFSSQSRNQVRTELIVLLSAKILRDQASTSVAMNDLFQDMLELKQRGLLPEGR